MQGYLPLEFAQFLETRFLRLGQRSRQGFIFRQAGIDLLDLFRCVVQLLLEPRDLSRSRKRSGRFRTSLVRSAGDSTGRSQNIAVKRYAHKSVFVSLRRGYGVVKRFKHRYSAQQAVGDWSEHFFAFHVVAGDAQISRKPPQFALKLLV